MRAQLQRWAPPRSRLRGAIRSPRGESRRRQPDADDARSLAPLPPLRGSRCTVDRPPSRTGGFRHPPMPVVPEGRRGKRHRPDRGRQHETALTGRNRPSRRDSHWGSDGQELETTRTRADRFRKAPAARQPLDLRHQPPPLGRVQQLSPSALPHISPTSSSRCPGCSTRERRPA